MNLSMNNFYKDYLEDKHKPDSKLFFGILCGCSVCGGIYGMVYETLFYLIDRGALCRRGSSFGPWIEIYGLGALLIYALCHRYKKKPLKVFLIAGISSGLLEYLAGWGMYHLLDGRRGWNYNIEIWNWGNIDGFVCARSVLVFAFSGILLIYAIYPLLLWLSQKINRKLFLTITFTLAALFAIDVIYNDVIVTIFHSYSSLDFYKQFDCFKYYNETKIH